MLERSLEDITQALGGDPGGVHVVDEESDEVEGALDKEEMELTAATISHSASSEILQEIEEDGSERRRGARMGSRGRGWVR